METVMFTSPLLAWETATDPDPGDVVAYVVYIDETAGFTSADSVETAETGVYTPYCAPGSIWYWRVKAVDSFGAFTLSETRAFYVDLDAGPRPVNDLMIELLDDDDIELTWTAIPGADRYDVYTSTTPYGAFSLYDNTVADFYLDVDGALAGELYYQVIAVDEDLLFNYWRDLDGQRIDRVTK
jgi:hypothetical protein